MNKSIFFLMIAWSLHGLLSLASEKESFLSPTTSKRLKKTFEIDYPRLDKTYQSFLEKIDEIDARDENSSNSHHEENSDSSEENSNPSPYDPMLTGSSSDSPREDRMKEDWSNYSAKKILEQWTKSFLKQLEKKLPKIQKLIDGSDVGQIEFLKTLPIDFKMDYLQLIQDPLLSNYFDYQSVLKIISHATKIFKDRLGKKTIKTIKRDPENTYILEARLASPDEVHHCIGDQHGGLDYLNFIETSVSSTGEIQASPFDETLHITEENKNKHYFSLGDITDGGLYSLAALLINLVFYCKNPDNVHLIRGNHESGNLNRHYGFFDELKKIFGQKRAEKLTEFCKKLYNTMPVAYFPIFEISKEPQSYQTYLLCHGGIEPTQDPKQLQKLFEKAIDSPETATHALLCLETGSTCKYLWSDFTAKAETPCDLQEESRPTYNKEYVEQWISKCILNNKFSIKLGSILRAHQHDLGYNNDNGLMPILYANSHIAHLWERLKTLILTEAPGSQCGFGVPVKKDDSGCSYCGVVGLSSVVIYNNGAKVACMQLPNSKIPKKTIKEFASLYAIHLVEIEKITDLRKKFTDRKKDTFLYLLHEYKKYAGMSRYLAPIETLEKFLIKHFTVDKPHIFARFKSNKEGHGLQQDLSEYAGSELLNTASALTLAGALIIGGGLNLVGKTTRGKKIKEQVLRYLKKK